MTRMVKIAGASAVPLQEATMHELGLLETDHLENWVIQNPELIDPKLMIVTTQFANWESDVGTARERPDILGLAASGELVVIELKRGKDRHIHLQAITYGSLAAGFTIDTLAAAHADWRHKFLGEDHSVENATAALIDHVDGELDESLFSLPRLVLVAESFPGQVLTTVQWLRSSYDLTIECHEYGLFTEQGSTFASFRRVFPIQDLADQFLRPTTGADHADTARDRVTANRRRARSVSIIQEANLIPDGALMELDLRSMVRPTVAEQVNTWLDEVPERREVRWRSGEAKSLVWAHFEDPGLGWSPTALRNEIFKRAIGKPGSFSAADAWSYEGRCLYVIASDYLADQE